MKVQYVMTGIGVLPERRDNVSGHVQLPLKTCELLRDSGHSVAILATAQSDGSAMPSCLPENVVVDIVSDGRKRGQLGKQNSKNGFRFFPLIKQVLQTISIIRSRRPDIIHVFGFERMVAFAGILRFATRIPVVVTVLGQTPSLRKKRLYNQIGSIHSLTDSVAKDWSTLGVPVSVIRPGVVRSVASAQNVPMRRRVLFWREASVFGGADTCLAAFVELAPRYPNIEFCFAVRHNKDEIPELELESRRHENISIYRFPYTDCESLEQLIESSLFAVLPYRELSIEPQMTVVEPLSVGCPVVTTNIRCLPELVEHGDNGLVIPCGDTNALTDAISMLLDNPDFLSWDRKRIVDEFEKKWNWPLYADQIKDLYDEQLKKK